MPFVNTEQGHLHFSFSIANFSIDIPLLTSFRFRKRPGTRQKARDWNRSRKGSPCIDCRYGELALTADFPLPSAPPLLSPVQSSSLPQRPPQPAPTAVRRLTMDNQQAVWQAPAARHHSGGRQALVGLF